MARVEARPAAATRATAGDKHIGSLLDREGPLAYLFMIPTGVLLIVFMAYPFFLGIYLSMTDRMIGFPGSSFIGLQNYRTLLHDSIFRQTVLNTFIYGFATVPFKLLLGLILALLLNREFRGRRWARAGLLLPWIVPTALSSLAWLMLYDSVLSPFTWLLKNLGLVDHNIPFLATHLDAVISLVVANVWRGIPFFAISILAGLQAVPADLHEAAAIDGANALQRFWAVTFPVIRGITVIATLFSVIWTFADFQLIYVLTKGGPANSTHVFGTYAYQIGMAATELGQGAAVSLYMFPFLVLFAMILLRFVRAED